MACTSTRVLPCNYIGSFDGNYTRSLRGRRSIIITIAIFVVVVVVVRDGGGLWRATRAPQSSELVVQSVR